MGQLIPHRQEDDFSHFNLEIYPKKVYDDPYEQGRRSPLADKEKRGKGIGGFCRASTGRERNRMRFDSFQGGQFVWNRPSLRWGSGILNTKRMKRVSKCSGDCSIREVEI